MEMLERKKVCNGPIRETKKNTEGLQNLLLMTITPYNTKINVPKGPFNKGYD